eukprot:731085_1
MGYCNTTKSWFIENDLTEERLKKLTITEPWMLFVEDQKEKLFSVASHEMDTESEEWSAQRHFNQLGHLSVSFERIEGLPQEYIYSDDLDKSQSIIEMYQINPYLQTITTHKHQIFPIHYTQLQLMVDTMIKKRSKSCVIRVWQNGEERQLKAFVERNQHKYKFKIKYENQTLNIISNGPHSFKREYTLTAANSVPESLHDDENGAEAIHLDFIVHTFIIFKELKADGKNLKPIWAELCRILRLHHLKFIASEIESSHFLYNMDHVKLFGRRATKTYQGMAMVCNDIIKSSVIPLSRHHEVYYKLLKFYTICDGQVMNEILKMKVCDEDIKRAEKWGRITLRLKDTLTESIKNIQPKDIRRCIESPLGMKYVHEKEETFGLRRVSFEGGEHVNQLVKWEIEKRRALMNEPTGKGCEALMNAIHTRNDAYGEAHIHTKDRVRKVKKKKRNHSEMDSEEKEIVLDRQIEIDGLSEKQKRIIDSLKPSIIFKVPAKSTETYCFVKCNEGPMMVQDNKLEECIKICDNCDDEDSKLFRTLIPQLARPNYKNSAAYKKTILLWADTVTANFDQAALKKQKKEIDVDNKKIIK